MPNSNLSNSVAAEIRAEMARLGLSAMDVYELVGMTSRTFHRSLKGERALHIDEVEVISKCLGLQVDELIRRATTNEAA